MSDMERANPFHPLGDETEHFWLAQRMAKATGADLAGAMEDHSLNQEDWAGMVRRCQGCEWTCGCKRWLNQPDPAEREVPATCANQNRFEALRNKHKVPGL